MTDDELQIAERGMRNLRKTVKICVRLWLISLCLGALPFQTKAQVRPVYDYGAIGLGQLLKKLNTTKSVMHIGAHPDDEDSGLLAYLARGENARTAYLSLTRGDGGQNIIGSELFESLGVIRTEELLQARRLDGAEQYFTRAFDYGFSKTLAEAKSKWDEKIVLCDAVRAIRNFRPLVVISRFSGTPADGHGQHQYAGYIAPLAVKAAADPNQCQSSGAPWRVLKFYVSQGFRSTEQPSLKVNTGRYDTLIGRSYFEIAMEGRSQHKTQEQGVLELKGERFSGLNLKGETKTETEIFDGIDVSIPGTGRVTNNSEEPLVKKLDALQKITGQLNSNLAPDKLLSLLMQGYKVANDAEWSTRNPQTKFFLQKKQEEFTEAVKMTTGLQIDALANRETVVPGETFQTSVKIFSANKESVKIEKIYLSSLTLNRDLIVNPAETPKTENQNPFRNETADASAEFNVKVSSNAKLTAPYWMESPRKSDLFDWQNDENQNLPFQSPIIFAIVKTKIDETDMYFKQPVEFRYADDIRGEIRREINIVPKVSLKLNQELLIVPQSRKAQTRTIKVNVKNNSSQSFSGTIDLILPPDWKLNSKFGIFSLNKKDENATVNFEVEIPANVRNGSYEIKTVARIGEETFMQTMQTFAYPHIQTHRFYTEAKTKVDVFDLKTAPVKVGYITGSGDAVAESIRQMGLAVEMLGESDLANSDLSRFDVIVVGIRAFQVRPDVVSNNQKLLDYVKNGGELIVQYQRPEYESLLPFPAKLGARVTDENAKITILDPANPVFSFPNKITDADFENWVQERNLYAFSTFDEKYKSLLEAHDSGEAENKGGLVVAEIGKGKFIYCSYALFRQLPVGVPGAYRLFANLLSLPKAKTRK